MARPVTTALQRAGAWFREAVPLGRIAAFRTLVYLFVIADLTVVTPFIADRGGVDAELYRPLFVGRVLPLPTPAPVIVTVLFWVLVVSALVASTGRLPRAAGIVVAVCYFEWMIIGMSYGKVDHDRFAFLLALALLPTAGAARHGDERTSEAAGWVLRMTQVAVVATYFLSAVAKIRFGTWRWPFSSVLAWALLRRSGGFFLRTGQIPYVLVVMQFVSIVAEFCSPVLFVLKNRWRAIAIGACYVFHLVTFMALGISFAPHLVAMCSFLPLERVRPLAALRSVTRGRAEDMAAGRSKVAVGP